MILLVSIEAQNKSFSRRLSLNRAILKNKYWSLPVNDVGHENYQPVGRGVRSSPVCGQWVSLSVCKNVEGHKGISIGGVDCSGKVVAFHRHLWCHKSSCPVCFIRGWSVRGARNIEGRFAEAVERGFGEVEHIVVSPSVVDRDLSESFLRKKCRGAMFDRGVIGGCMIFHGFRIDRERGVLVWSPHYHCLGFVFGGYSCRGCKKLCDGCNGFEATTRECFKKDGYIVRVLAQRKTVFGTAHYQLNHATIRLGVKRFHVVTWCGVCGYRNFKSKELLAEVLCPACGGEMVRSVYVGKRFIVKDVGHVDYVPWFVDDEFDEDGNDNFIDVVSSGG